MNEELRLSEPELVVAVDRIAAMPPRTRRLLERLTRNERQWYVGLIALFDARPAGYEPPLRKAPQMELLHNGGRL